MQQDDMGPPANDDAPPEKPKNRWDAVFSADGQLWCWAPPDPDSDGRMRAQLTDCLLTILYKLRDKEGVTLFEIEAVHPDGSSFTKHIRAGTLENHRDMNALGTELGGCWFLDERKLAKLKRYLLSQPGARREITVPEFSGFQAKYGVWIFNQFCVDANGVYHEVDRNDLVRLRCLDGTEREFRTKDIPTSETPSMAPRLTAMTEEDHDGKIHSSMMAHVHRVSNEFIIEMKKNLGRHSGALALGWCVGNIFRDVVYKERNAFPHLYFLGRWGSGKDTVARWLYDIMGMTHCQPAPATSGTTVKGVRDSMSAVCNLPFWINEMRKDNDFALKVADSVRSLFDGQGGKISSKNRAPVQALVNRGLMISGEDILGADAEITRFVLLKMRNTDIVEEFLPDVQALIPPMQEAWQILVANRNQIAPRFMQLVQEYELLIGTGKVRVNDELIPVNIHARQRFCWALALAGLAILLHGNPLYAPEMAIPEDILLEARVRAMDTKADQQAHGILGAFWNELESLVAEQDFKNTGTNTWLTHVKCEDKPCIALWVPHIVRAINQRRRGGVPFSHTMLLQQLQDHKCFVAQKTVRFTYSEWRGERLQHGSVLHHAMVFDAKRTPSLLPQWLKDLKGDAPMGGHPEDDGEDEQEPLI